jgi:hypothetical protein
MPSQGLYTHRVFNVLTYFSFNSDTQQRGTVLKPRNIKLKKEKAALFMLLSLFDPLYVKDF